MPFNSLDFAIFFLIFYVIYLGLHKLYRVQNIWLLAGSYAFYAAWDWHFLLILVGITGGNYIIGRGLGGHPEGWLANPLVRRILLGVGLLGNLGTLIFFKYADYFKVGLARLTAGIDLPLDAIFTYVVLPVGLSFYALQASSYLLDVSSRRIQPTRSLVELALFIGFFPQLLAGPIERAGRMLPQFARPRKLEAGQVSAGIYLLFSGFFKKIVVADNLGVMVNKIFDNYTSYSGIDLVIGGLAFTLQLYADFSAYSDIARGLARLIGFELMVNFRLPYFAATPAEFWSRWHISLSEWLRDYIFFPLRRALLRWKGSPARLAGLIVPPLVTLLVSGIWHGTGWNFIVWGLYHAVLLILFQLFIKERPVSSENAVGIAGKQALANIFSSVQRILVGGVRIFLMFGLVWLGWLIFRSATPDQLWYFLTHLSLMPSPETSALWANLVLYSLPVVAVQILQQLRGELLVLARLPVALRIVIYSVALGLIVVLGVRQTSEFIYVQF